MPNFALHPINHVCLSHLRPLAYFFRLKISVAYDMHEFDKYENEMRASR